MCVCGDVLYFGSGDAAAVTVLVQVTGRCQSYNVKHTNVNIHKDVENCKKKKKKKKEMQLQVINLIIYFYRNQVYILLSYTYSSWIIDFSILSNFQKYM